VKKIDHPTNKNEAVNIIIELRRQQDTLNFFAEKDNEIYQQFLSAYKLKHDTPAEKRFRDSVINATLIAAINSPLDAAELLHRIFSLCNKSKKFVKPNVLSDITASGLILHATFTSIVTLAKDNISQLPASERTTYQNKIIKLEALQTKMYNTFLSTNN
jgi:formiminotetrahydrofolate cyclodeaminase